MSANLRTGEFGEAVVANILTMAGFPAQANINQSGASDIFITHGKIVGVQVKTITGVTAHGRVKDGGGSYGFKLIDNPNTPTDRYDSEEVSLFAFLILDKDRGINHLYVIPKSEILMPDGSMPTKRSISINSMDDPNHWAFRYRDNFSAIEEITGNPPRHKLEEPSEVWVVNHLNSIPKRIKT